MKARANMDGAELIAAERERQRGLGYSASHDDEHTRGSLARVASDIAAGRARSRRRHGWLRGTGGDRVAELVVAGALIAAEIDRLHRAQRRSR